MKHDRVVGRVKHSLDTNRYKRETWPMLRLGKWGKDMEKDTEG